jgi:hypothetical protein
MAMLDFLSTLHTTEHVVYLSGDSDGLSLWFSGPRQAGDFIAHWSSTIYPMVNIPLRPLLPPGQYIAIRPDDMLSVQEAFMASEGMDTYSICPTCQAKGLHVLSTSAAQQKFGNPNRAIRFFCKQCQSICDEPAVTPYRLARFLNRSLTQCAESQQILPP